MSKVMGVPYGYCRCGCGLKTPLYTASRPGRGVVKGEPKPYAVHFPRGVEPSVWFWRLVSIRGENECWQWKLGRDKHNYGVVHLNGRCVKSHRLAYELSTGQTLGKRHALHTCDNPSCNNPAHLYAGTPLDNARDCINRGRAKKAIGQANGRAKLTPESVVAIRQIYASGGISQRQLAAQHHVGKRTIDCILSGLTWRHVPQPEGMACVTG